MASALQCPACGHKHRLAALTGDPIFACEQCGRLLKTPAEYRRPEPSGPVEPPRPAPSGRVQRGGSATRDQTSVFRTPTAAVPAAAGAAPRVARRPPRAPATLTVPLQILGWVVAVLLGGILARYFGKFTGLLTGNSVIDILTGTGWGRYARVFALVPFWALFAAGLMTAFVEGARVWQARRGAPRSPRPTARRVPPVPANPRPPSASQKPRPPAPNPAAAETRSPSGAAAAPRSRRIPKRDISS